MFPLLTEKEGQTGANKGGFVSLLTSLVKGCRTRRRGGREEEEEEEVGARGLGSRSGRRGIRRQGEVNEWLLNRRLEGSNMRSKVG